MGELDKKGVGPVVDAAARGLEVHQAAQTLNARLKMLARRPRAITDLPSYALATVANAHNALVPQLIVDMMQFTLAYHADGIGVNRISDPRLPRRIPVRIKVEEGSFPSWIGEVIDGHIDADLLGVVGVDEQPDEIVFHGLAMNHNGFPIAVDLRMQEGEQSEVAISVDPRQRNRFGEDPSAVIEDIYPPFYKNLA